jgi:hypothetical protein
MLQAFLAGAGLGDERFVAIDHHDDAQKSFPFHC